MMPLSRFRLAVPAALALALGLASVSLYAQEARWPPPPDAGPAVIPAPPEDPTQAKVYAVLDRLCAQCHQTGKLAVPQPGYGLGHILDIPRLAADPTLVKPGNPDGSRLYTLLQIRSAPHDVDSAGKDLEVAASDLDALRDWINGVKPATACPDRAPLTLADDEQAIASAANDTPLTTRYLSLRALYNACATPADLKAHRHAVTVAVNSLSWSLKPIALTTIDPQETLLKVDLGALGWDAARWQRLIEVYPYGLTEGKTSVAASPGTLRADWFVATALTPPLYYDLLGLPDRLPTLQTSLRIDAAADLTQNRLRRIGIKTSAVARGSRLAQRHTFANGGFWTSFEYAPTTGRPDLFDAPGGPGSRGAPKPDASLSLFQLPSGYSAFFIANGDGLRINDLPQSVVRHDGFPSQRISAGADCLACHSRGVLPATDELRARVQGDTSIPRDIREKVLATHASGDENRRLMEEDNTRLAGALAQSGLVPGATHNGLDPLVGLISRYDRDVSLDDLAGEVAQPASALRALAGRTPGLAGDLIDRIVHGNASRKHVERAYTALLNALDNRLNAAEGALTLPAETERPEGLQLVLKTGPASFRAGEALTIRARVSAACYLTLINIDRNGRGSVIYPNDFEQNNLLEAGKELRVPADGAPYVFRLREPGREAIVGHCMTASKAPPGILHDFERQRFTELGDYRAFLNRTATNEPEARSGAKATAEQKQRRRGRNAPAPMQSAPQKGEGQARVAVQIEIAP
jgi:hypothetical protein